MELFFVLVSLLQAKPLPQWLLPPSQVTPRSYRLHEMNKSDVAYRYEGDLFVADIAPDGSVAFRRPTPSPSLHVIPFAPGTRYNAETGSRVSRAVERLTNGKMPSILRPPPPMPKPSPQRPMPRYENCKPIDLEAGTCGDQTPQLVTVAVKFDLNDELLSRFSKEDPARIEKARFLDATLEIRRKLALASRMRTILAAVHDLPRQLDEISRSADFTSAERTTLLSEVRDALLAANRRQEAAHVQAYLNGRDRPPRPLPPQRSEE